MLPIPFTAAELAAFMLDGVGGMIPETLGARIGYPVDEAVLPDSPRWRVVREALQAAYALAEAAQAVVGEFDHAEQRAADELRKKYSEARSQAIERERVMERVIVGEKKDGSPEYGAFIPRDEYLHRLELAKSSVAELEAQSTHAQDAVSSKWRAWRAAMVLQLLAPEVGTSPPPRAGTASSVQNDGRVWTPERLAAVEEYRNKHGTKKTAEHFGVSAQLIRRKLPSKKPSQKGFSAFTHRPK